MRPDFALSLSFSGISLLQRAASAGGPARGWYLLGEVALDVEDLSGAMAVLREEALSGAQAEGPEVKLILPEEQVKYLSIPLSDDNPVAAVEAALEGATPYAVNELVYDWRASEGQLQIAAVARETLDEAEAFARDNSFVPLGFAAAPQADQFDGEPFFGPTAIALTSLTPGTQVRGDDEAIDIIDGAPARDAPIAVESPAPADPVEAASAPGIAPTSTAEEEAPSATAPQAAEPASDPLHTDKQSDVAPQQATPETATVSEAQSDPAPEQNPALTAVEEAVEEPSPGEAAPVLPSPAAVPMSAQKLDVTPADDRADTPTPGFASLRAQRDAPAPPAPKARTLDPAAEGKTPPLTAKGAATASEPSTNDDADGKKPSFADAIRARAVESLAAPADLPNDPPGMSPGSDATTKTGSGSDVSGVLARAQSGLGRGAAFVTRRTSEMRAARAEKASSPPTPGSGGAAAALAGGNKMDEAERMTVFGARRSAKQQVGGKPRFLGLMLTAALLIFLLAVAAWASVFVEDGLARLFGGGDNDEPPVETALSTPSPEVVQPTPADAEPTLALPETGSDGGPLDTDIATLTPGLPAVGETTTLTDDLGLARPIGVEALSSEEAEARYAATGIWQRAPIPPAELRQGVLDDLYVASIDTDVLQQDAVALPAALSFASDAGLAEQKLPPGPNDRFDFDDRGLIRPSAEGVVAPGGYTIVLGRPEVTPPARRGQNAAQTATLADPGTRPSPRVRPDTLAVPQPQGPGVTIAPGDVSETQTASPGTSVSAPVVVDQSLRGLRPLPRPDDLSEINERANLGGITIAELGRKRPLIRPLVVERRAAQALRAEPEAEPETPSPQAAVLEAAVADALQEATTAPAPPASKLAVIESIVPKSRPGNISRIVRRAERVQEQEATRVASAVAPRTVQPRIPSSSSVSRAATQRNAINLRRVNLIGVYGRPSDRRALVRLSNGRYKKVKVGDRVDGGRVTAISDDQLRYQKGGRNLTLKLPQG